MLQKLNNYEFDCFIDAYKAIALSLINIKSFCNTRLGDAVSADKPFTISIKSLSDALELDDDSYIFDKTYAKAFAEHIISGCDKELRKLAPNSAKKFLDRPAELPENISVLYCDKIAKQIEFVLKELNENKNTRRAIISFIDSNDFKITELEPTKHLEFSCTAYLSFFIKENKLNVHINMRSQSFALLPLDANNFYNLHKHISSKLNIEQGKCFYTFSNLHLYRKHEKLAINIAELEYMH